MLNSRGVVDYKFIMLRPEYIEQHIQQFLAIAADIPKEGWTLENYLYELPGKWQYSLAAVNEHDEVIGFIIASDKAAAIHIHKYAVHPQYRSKGIGLWMLQKLEKGVKATGYKIISLYVDASNAGAIRFYEKQGFELQEKVETMLFFKKNLKLIVAIHQPNFFPWLGFFHKMAHCDKFIILDHVTNRPNDAIYTKRVTIVCNNQEYWLTVPIAKPKGIEFLPINEMKVVNDGFEKKQLKTIEMNYKKTPYFQKYFPLFEVFYKHASPYIAERNLEVIKHIAKELNIDTPIYLSSAIPSTAAATQLLVQLVKAVQGDVYLHGSAAVSDTGYQQNDLFFENGIGLVPQQFKHPVYTQYNNKGPFVFGTSIMDALMNADADKVSTFLS